MNTNLCLSFVTPLNIFQIRRRLVSAEPNLRNPPCVKTNRMNTISYFPFAPAVDAQYETQKDLAADREHRFTAPRTGNFAKARSPHPRAVPCQQNHEPFGSTLASFLSWRPGITFSASIFLAIALLALSGQPARAVSAGDAVVSKIDPTGKLVLDAPEPTGQPSSIIAGKQVQIYTANPSPNILGGFPGKGSPNQWWFFQNEGSYGYIYNAARQDLVLDVRGITGPVPDSNLVSVRGTPVQLYPVNKPATLNQLWRWVPLLPSPSDPHTLGKIVSALNPKLVLDVTGNPIPSKASGTKLVVYTVNTPITANQLWSRYSNEILH